SSGTTAARADILYTSEKPLILTPPSQSFLHHRLSRSNSAHATAHECQPATGSRLRSRSNNFSRPAHCEYLGFLILNHVLASRSVTYGACFCFATMPSKSNSQIRWNNAVPEPST